MPIVDGYIPHAVAGSGGSPRLIIGNSVGVDAHDTTFAPGPPRMLCPALPVFQHTYCHSDPLPSIANGFAYFLPYKVTSGPGDKYLCALAPITASSFRGRSGYLFVNNATPKVISASLHDETGVAGGVIRSAVATTNFVNNTWYCLGLWFDGDKLRIVVNGEVEGESASFTGPALSAAGEVLHIGWPSNNLSFATGPDNCEWGSVLLYAKNGLTFTASQLFELFSWFKLTYTDLP